MELYQIRTYLAIMRTGNLTKAAEILNASQPAVSAQLKALEDELGVALFSRTPRGMTATEAGALLRSKAEEVIGKADELLSLAGVLGGRPTGSCRIGLNTEAGLLRVAALVEELSAAAPALRLFLVQGVTRAIVEDVSGGKLDGGFVFGTNASEGLAAERLGRIELAIAAPAAWKTRLKGAPLSAILGEPWVWPPLECPFHAKALALFRDAGKVPPQGVTADDESTIMRLVRARVGLSLLPAFIVEEEERKGEVAVLTRPGSDIELEFISRKSDAESQSLKPVLEAVRRAWRTGRG